MNLEEALTTISAFGDVVDRHDRVSATISTSTLRSYHEATLVVVGNLNAVADAYFRTSEGAARAADAGIGVDGGDDVAR